ncbi:MAG: 1-deoxy-D-xylulose-5-phosphate reductoisomerase [Phycisphaerae bacterium]|nr:1-deoxy-D-xylulose-5-phosphate reductoisomerase [Phycisphaerae bacterium]
MRQRVIILGSTGSIGQSTVDVIEALSGSFEVVGLAAGSRCDELAGQANRLRPPAVAIANGENADRLADSLAYDPKVFRGPHALEELVDAVECDCVVSGVVGSDGLAATLRAAELGRRIALANKEALVLAGSILMPLARRNGAEIIPVDSEHSALFQAMQAGRADEVERIYLTASGGPFRTWTAEQMDAVTLEDALQHPTWEMGPKITIDSATMMNKALEIIEARWLFDLPPERIDVVIHPESIVHSMVEFRDGSFVAQLGAPDMRLPIQYALTYPHRMPGPARRLRLGDLRRLHFDPPDPQRFPALRLGYAAAERGGTCGAVLNAANESAVQLFRERRIAFREIAAAVEHAIQEHDYMATPALEQLLAADRWARTEVNRCLTC